MVPAAEGARRHGAHRLAFWFAVVTLLLYAAVVVRGVVDGETAAPFLVGGVLVLAALVLGWLTLYAWKRIQLPVLRTVVCGVLAYHACFGPVFLTYMLTTRVTTNDDLPHRLYPHVVRAINSLE